ncbi:uncharacterized protein [Epargyreus clarus]|uniref:uncharacterized protein n=1 Tax=Epargyreus clarus TaxID=520877 RepID=UPI003C2B36A8
MRGAAIILICAAGVVLGNGARLKSKVCPEDHTIDRLFPHESCNKFYQCASGYLVTRKCADNLHFNVETQQCDWPDRVACEDRITDNDKSGEIIDDGKPEDNSGDNNSGGNDDPSKAPTLCAAEGSDGILVAHEHCNKFYKCFTGFPLVFRCPSNLLYNPRTEQCDWPENVVCGNRIIPDGDGDNGGGGGGGGGDNNNGGNDDPSKAPTICAAEGSDGILIAHEHCNKFYKCFEGRPVAFPCPLNLLYNPRTEQCDWPENVVCGNRIIPDGDGDNGGGGGGGGGDNNNGGNDDPSKAPTICAAEGSDGILIAHEHCNKFYKCFEGRPAAFPCPSNLLYNPRTEQCDWPENVVCGNRIIPDGDGDNDGGGGGGGSDNNNGGNDDPSKAPTICAAEGSDGILIAHEHCNKFYKCFEGRPAAFPCPSNLLYNPRTEQCDWPENVVCGNRIIPDGDGDNGGGGGGGGGDNNNGGNDDPSKAPTICAAEGSDGILIAHEHCNKFYKCFEGRPAAFPCPSNLLYNPRTEQCDWPENVVCGNRIIPDGDGDNGGGGGGGGGDNNNGGNDDPSKAPTICAAEGSDGILIAHEHCNKFYKCFEGRPAAFPCPSNLLYNPRTEQCDWPENVVCGNRIIPDGDGDNGGGGGGGGGDNNNGGNDDPSKAPTICAAEGSDGILIAHEHCNKFYKCFEGRPVAFPCPLNLLYNPRTEQCDWPENVVCGNRIIPDGDGDNGGGGGGGGGDNNNGGNDDPSKAPTICAAEGSDGILIAHEHCNKFYKCFEGRPVAFPCPLNLLYNPRTEQCDWPENVVCGNRIIPDGDGDNGGGGGGGGGDNNNGGNDDPSKAPTICAAEGSDGILIAHEHCNKFYKCFEGRPAAFPCPSNLLYNPRTEQCDWPENVVCGNRIIPDGDGDNGGGGGSGGGDNNNGGNDDPSKAPTICAAEGSDGILIAHEHCNKFYKCFEGRPAAFPCPSNLLYNPRTEQCDWPENVVCGNRIIPDGDGDNGGGGGGGGGDNNNGGNDDPSKAPTICAAEGSDGILIAHEHCNKFYKCFEGRPAAFPCPSNLLYNPRTEQCDWPENVVCGNRIIPDGDGDNGGGGGGGGGDNNNGGNDDPSKAPTICAAEGSDGILIAHEHCNKFYKCFEGRPAAFPCPSNLLYNPRTEQCDWPENVVCGNRIIPDSDGDNGGGGGGDNNNGGNDDPSKAPTICAAEGSDGILIAHEHCNKFYKCFEGRPAAFPCPSNLLYNPRTEQCDWPENVVCGNRIIPDGDGDNGGGGGGGGGDNNNGGNDDPSKAPTICAAEGSDGILIAHEHCNKFYKCFEGRPAAFPCPSNLLYNPRTEQCDWPENVVCGNRIIPDSDGDNGGGGGGDNNNGGNDDPSKAPTICAAEGSDGILIAHEHCNKFYKCFEGRPAAFSCPSNLLYNPRKEQCDWPENVVCGDRIIPDAEDVNEDDNAGGGGGSDGDDNKGNDDPSEAPIICAAEGSDGILVAHEQCDKFYKCYTGFPLAFKCPSNLMFNPRKEQCDWSENVECGDRLVL